ncbi:MAG: cache domain-containing protein [Deltaproteobacteria bacterium]|nr:cache domain-containing protein [Deltaproteobacteria bacterium]
MRKVAFFTALMFVLISSTAAFAGPAPQKVIDLANSQLAALGTDATVVKAVNTANSENKTLAQIQELDAQWKADKAAGKTAPYMTELMQNDAAKQLNTLMAQHSFITEIFVTDNQGANVAQTGGTGDYWQGDEAKFQKVFQKGILVSDVEQEDGKNISQVSIPVLDGQTHIGTMTIGVDVDQVP